MNEVFSPKIYCDGHTQINTPTYMRTYTLEMSAPRRYSTLGRGWKRVADADTREIRGSADANRPTQTSSSLRFPLSLSRPLVSSLSREGLLRDIAIIKVAPPPLPSPRSPDFCCRAK